MPSTPMPDPSTRRLVLGGGLAVAGALLVYSLAGSDAPAPADPAPPPAAAALEAAPAMPVPRPVTTPQPTSAEGLILYGVAGGGPGGLAAVIGPAAGSQRLVRVGRDYRPGLTVKEVGPAHAVLTSAGVDTRLELYRFAGTAPASAAAPATPAGPPAATSGALDKAALLAGMSPHRQGDRIKGFTLKAGAGLAPLLKAGLRQGDVLVAVNGQAFDSSEKLLELPSEIAGAYTAEFEYERNGKRMKASLPVNPRPSS
jgi:general secretion pathway protein C